MAERLSGDEVPQMPSHDIHARRKLTTAFRRRMRALFLFGCGYVAMFYSCRRSFSVTVDLQFHTLQCWYFSEDPTTNKCAFYVFRPLIAVTGGVELHQIATREDAVRHAERRSNVYVLNRDDCL
jgi:hypothetical protein